MSLVFHLFPELVVVGVVGEHLRLGRPFVQGEQARRDSGQGALLVVA